MAIVSKIAESFRTAKAIINKMERQPMGWEGQNIWKPCIW